MPQVARKGKDVAGGLIVSGRTSVIVNNTPIACEGDTIAPHAPGTKHNGAVIVGHTQNVAREGDPASCGHLITPGASNVFAGT